MRIHVDRLNNAFVEQIVKIAGKRVKARLYGVAEPVLVRDRDKEKTLPAVITCDGECLDVFADCDLNDVVIYHRMHKKSYTPDAEHSRGSRVIYRNIYDMTLLVYGKRKINHMEIESALSSVISREQHCTIVSSNFNAVEVYAGEYSGMPFFLNPEYFLFKINYQITGIFDNGCHKF